MDGSTSSIGSGSGVVVVVVLVVVVRAVVLDWAKKGFGVVVVAAPAPLLHPTLVA